MKVNELYEKAETLDFLDEDVDNVVNYLRVLSNNDVLRGTCGACAIRKTKECPWAGQNGLMSPICLSFKPKNKELLSEEMEQDKNFGIELIRAFFDGKPIRYKGKSDKGWRRKLDYTPLNTLCNNLDDYVIED